MPTLVMAEARWIGGKAVLQGLCDIEFVLLVTDVSLEEMNLIC